MASVDIEEVRKSFGAVEVLHGVDLAINDGEFVVLVGPSGCGKSTLLRMIAGLEDVSSGYISIDGRVVNTVTAKDRDIAMVFQSYALYPHMTVFDNMGFSLKLARVSKEDIRQRVEEAADTLGLRELLGRHPRQLSGGQRQRVAMGRAIVRDPKVFLFDEPLSNLDAKLRVSMRTEVKSLHQRLGTTAIYVTHDQIEAMTMADKIVVMNEGHIEQIGKPMDLYERPANLFVAGFIGSPGINLLPGTTVRANDALTVKVDEKHFLPLPSNVPLQEGVDVIYGLRPRAFELIQGSGVPVRVNVVEPTGSETFVYCDLAGHPICVQLEARENVKADSIIQVAPHLESVHIFSPESGRRLN